MNIITIGHIVCSFNLYIHLAVLGILEFKKMDISDRNNRTFSKIGGFSIASLTR